MQVRALVREWKAHLTPGRVLQSYLCWVTAEVLEITGATGRVNLRGREVSDVIKPHLEVWQPRGITAPGIVITSPWNCSSKRRVSWGPVCASPWSSQMLRPQRNPLRTGRRRQMSSGPQRNCWETKKTRTPSTDSIYRVQRDMNSSPSCRDTNPSGFKKKFKNHFSRTALASINLVESRCGMQPNGWNHLSRTRLKETRAFTKRPPTAVLPIRP